jgi:hypothetical protein
MPTIKITNKQIPVHQDYFEFWPRWSLEIAEYQKAKFKSIDEDNRKPQSRFSGSTNDKSKSKGDLADELTHWPRISPTEELNYYQFINSITDPKTNKFHPARDEDRKPLPKTGAMHVITDLIRLKTGEGEQFLLSKGSIIGNDAAGEEIDFYLPFPEHWRKTLFVWSNEYNNATRQFEKRCLGPSGTEIVYLLGFNKDNAKQLFEQRATDLVNFILKDAVSDEARMVERDVNALKTFERFANNTFDYLWSGEYIPAPVRAELRQEAVARGYIKGGSGDFQITTQLSKAGKTTYQ